MTDLELETWVPAEGEVQAIQVTAENARAVAEWCGGWALDDLRWSERMRCYLRPDDDTIWAGSMFSTWGDEPTPGGVMLSFGVPAVPGDWVVLEHGRDLGRSDQEMRARYRRP